MAATAQWSTPTNNLLHNHMLDLAEYRAFEREVKTIIKHLQAAIMEMKYESKSPLTYHTINALDMWIHRAKVAVMRMNEGELALQKQRCPFMRESERQLNLLIKVGTGIGN